jgi:hypothetical protein
MKHYWVYFSEGYEECAKCQMRRRRRVVDFGDSVNPVHSCYRITEYARSGKFWKWVKSRERIPRCR